MASPMNFEDWLALTQLYADYASAVDSGQWDLWPEFFTDDCVYRLQPRENHERGFPLATLSFSSKGMLKAGADRFRCEANYAVFRTKLSDASTVFNVGRYLDVVVRTAAGLKFASRECIYDSEMIPNSIIYPI
jgi:salicylate 5-hydroxylase small subunit